MYRKFFIVMLITKYMHVCLGGTFNPLHKGHKMLISKALDIAGDTGRLFIGVTSGDIALKHGSVPSFNQRKKDIESFLDQTKKKKNVTIMIAPIYDRFGPAITDDFDAIVVSSETEATALEINQRRKKIGKKPLKIIVIPLVLDEDNQPIRSTRIRKKEIDENGKLIK